MCGFSSALLYRSFVCCLKAGFAKAVPVSIGFAVFMSSWAMGSGRLLSSSHIFGMSNWLQVGWIHTSAIAAKMIKAKAFGNGTNKQLVSNTMRKGHAPMRVIVEGAIASRRYIGLPQPTSKEALGLVNFRPKAFFTTLKWRTRASEESTSDRIIEHRESILLGAIGQAGSTALPSHFTAFQAVQR